MESLTQLFSVTVMFFRCREISLKLFSLLLHYQTLKKITSWLSLYRGAQILNFHYENIHSEILCCPIEYKCFVKMPPRKSCISRDTHRSKAVRKYRQKQKDDLEKLEIEVYEARVKLAGMRQKYAEYLASQKLLEASEHTDAPQETKKTSKTEFTNTNVGKS